ncbi:hypothetical protein F5X68DRAFT_162245 [Plectosphaerella plurivora]|uniref:Impact N-terminal domain-containing protein n=1 Tax=Plectosphaerella plurivora TaxID=936078 RepID=A0A9P8UUP7_9PEZI|nr:hypothetical protein F5X68DRAFT_162245 [Plectosphaerella plurivora]
MAGSQEDLQVLLRVLTRKNVSMLTVMRQAKSLQSAGLRSIQQIAEAPLDVITQALGDAKSAKAAHNSCKKHITDESQRQKKLKRSGNADCPDPGAQSSPKRLRPSSDDSVSSQSIMTEGADEDLQMSVMLDLERVASTRVYTNRAPLLLAFAFVLIRFTMPEQPVSSRLSLSQAVVSSNARSKAVSLGLEGQSSASHSSWTDGQPTVTIMGKRIPVLRRDGDALSKASLPIFGSDKAVPVPTAPVDGADGAIEPVVFSSWSKSEKTSSRGSTFVARIISISDAADGIRLVRTLIDAEELKTASHNSWGLRTRNSRTAVSSATGFVQQSEDDGETGCGAFILGLLKDAHLDNVLVVISRWFGGVLLGPQRWELMRKCFDGAISEHLRQIGQSGADGTVPLWALDVDGMERGHKQYSSRAEIVPGAVVFRPESARDYLSRSFLSAAPDITTPREAAARRRRVAASQGVSAAEHNMACVLGAIQAVFLSWEGHLSTKELDARAWVWYATVRPHVEAGPSGWGEKGWLELKDILALRRQQAPISEP